MLVGKEANFLRSYVCDNKNINSLKIFDQTGVVYGSGQGWFEAKEKSNSRDVIQLELPGLKRKIKENFTLKHPYRIKDEIYIPASMVAFKPLGEKLALETETKKYYHQYYSITLKCRLYSYNFEKDTDLNNLKERTLVVSSRYYSKTEATPLGVLVTSIEERTGVGSYDIEKILEHYDIVEKKEKKGKKK